MNIQELKEQIVKKKIKHFYIFTGEEIGIINIYLNQISKVVGLPIQRADSVVTVYPKCTTRSMFGNTIGLYVIRDDMDFPKQDKYFDTIEKDIGENYIILLYEKVDSRTKFSKHFKDSIVPFEKLSNNVLQKYIQRASGINKSNCEKLSSLCSENYDISMLECDKINQYSESRNVSKDKSFEELLSSGAIYQPEETSVFEFTDAVCSGKRSLAFELLENLNTTPGISINLLGTLYSSLKAVMLIQCCEGNVSEVTGLDKGQIYFNRKYVGKHSTEWLVNSVQFVYKVISGIKDGWIDDKYATKYVLAKIM